MNSSLKTVIHAVAIIGVSGFSGVVMAQNPEIGIYGRAHVTVDVLDNGADSGANVSSNSSRLGFRAKTDITDDLKGIFQIESTIRYDNGSGEIASRDTFVGLEGGFGGVRLGYFDTPLKKIRSQVDFFGDQIGDARNFTRLNGVHRVDDLNTGSYNLDFDARFHNGINYYTPSFGGFVIDVHYSTNTTGSTNPPNDEHAAYSVAGTYNAGDLYVSLAYETWEARNDSSAIRIGAKYRIGDLILAGLIQKATADANQVSLLIGGNNVAVTDDVTIDTIGFGASYKLSGNITIKGQIYSLSSDLDLGDVDATLLAIGLDYSISRQFRLLFAYAQAGNDDNVAYQVTGGGGYGDALATVAGEAAAGLSAGIRYDF